MKVTIDGTEHEIKPSDLSLDDGYALITPDNVPDGYYTQEALQTKIQSRLSKAEENAKEKLRDDKSFHKSVLDQYGVSLGADGKPKGLKPDVDVDEVKKNVAKTLSEQYEKEKAELKSELNSLKNDNKRSKLLTAARNIGIDDKYLNPIFEGGEPPIVKELSERFEYNKDIGDYALLESDGTFKLDGNGLLTADKFLKNNSDKFQHMMKDTRQRGSNFNGAGNPGNGSPKGDPSKWSRDTKLKFIGENGHDGYKKALNSYKESKATTEE